MMNTATPQHRRTATPQGGEGNTKPPPSSSVAYCFTLNNYTDGEYNDLKTFFIEKKYDYIIGREIGESGTPHLQGYVYNRGKLYFNGLKKICNRLHIEKAKGNPQQNYKYCSKDGNFESNMKFKISTDDFIKSVEQNVFDDEYKNVTWKPWQQEILNIIETKPDNRTIHWYYETRGNTGKSFLTKYIALKYDVIIADGKKADIFNQVNVMMREQQKIPAVIILDVPRRNQGYVSYGVLEQLKNGMIYSGKYEGGRCIFEAPHVIVFSNSLPDTSEMSADRWHIVNIDENMDKAFAALGLM